MGLHVNQLLGRLSVIQKQGSAVWFVFIKIQREFKQTTVALQTLNSVLLSKNLHLPLVYKQFHGTSLQTILGKRPSRTDFIVGRVFRAISQNLLGTWVYAA